MKDLEVTVKQLCENKKISLKDLALKIDMSYQNLYKCFKKGSMDTKDLEKIAEIFGISAGYFFDETTINASIQKKKNKVFLAFELDEDQEEKVIKMVMGKEFLKLISI